MTEFLLAIVAFMGLINAMQLYRHIKDHQRTERKR